MQKTKYTLLIFLFSIFIVCGQSGCKCCSDLHHQFDFWVGNWVVRDTLGTTMGKNVISKLEGNCVIHEKWKGANGTTGMSVNYYDPSDRTWNQL
ncbi:MAG: hypothetical protein AAF634_05715 [Bacteroidota bacterium]